MGRVTEVLETFFGNVYSITVAIIRLAFLAAAMLVSGVQLILFTRTEICNVEMKGQPWLCDRDKLADRLSFVDKVMLENQDLLDYADEHSDIHSEDDDEGI